MTTGPHLAPHVSIITLGVADLSVSRQFYQALGWQLAGQSNENIAFFQRPKSNEDGEKGGGVVLALFGAKALAKDAGVAPGQNGFRGVTLACNCANEAEVDAVHAYALQCGAKPVKQPEKVFWGGYSGYYGDPDGHLWEVAYNPFVKMDEAGHLHLDEHL